MKKENKIWIPKHEKELGDIFIEIDKSYKRGLWWGNKVAIDAVEKAIDNEFKTILKNK